MEGYFIEFASRAGEFLFRQRITALPATVGRALSNDFIVDDPHVAAQHLRLAADPTTHGKLLITDLGSRNGLFKAGHRTKEVALCSGECVHFGHTTLRLRHCSEEVAPERLDLFSSRVFSLPVALLLFALSIVFTVIDVPFERFGDITAVIWLGAMLGSAALLLGWAALWAVLGRIFAGRAQFVSHLAIAGWSMLIHRLGIQLFDVGAFVFSAPSLTLGKVVLIGTIAVWALHRHLSLAQMRWPRVNLPLAAVLVAIPATFTALNNWKSEHRLLDADTLDTLYDPALRIADDQTLDQFMSGMETLRSRAYALREHGKEYDDQSEGNGEDD